MLIQFAFDYIFSISSEIPASSKKKSRKNKKNNVYNMRTNVK